MTTPNTKMYTVGSLVGAATLGAFIAVAATVGDNYLFGPWALLAFGGVVGAIGWRGLAGKTLAERMADASIGPAEAPADLLDRVDDMRHRIVELEERLDFTERLLAQAREESKRLEVPR
ncbi:MAG: hypothetical protein R2910_04025 [Gemmatimonadales bacterium]